MKYVLIYYYNHKDILRVIVIKYDNEVQETLDDFDVDLKGMHVFDQGEILNSIKRQYKRKYASLDVFQPCAFVSAKEWSEAKVQEDIKNYLTSDILSR